jgi:hypothetical protein
MSNTSLPVNSNPNQVYIAANNGSSTSGYTYTTTNTSGYTLGEHVKLNNNPASLEVKGKIVHNGRDLEERLETIERVLMIPERDPELEKEFPKLKKAYDAYIRELEKYRTWKKLKDA